MPSLAKHPRQVSIGQKPSLMSENGDEKWRDKEGKQQCPCRARCCNWAWRSRGGPLVALLQCHRASGKGGCWITNGQNGDEKWRDQESKLHFLCCAHHCNWVFFAKFYQTSGGEYKWTKMDDGMITLHINYVAGYTGPLLFFFERTQQPTPLTTRGSAWRLSAWARRTSAEKSAIIANIRHKIQNKLSTPPSWPPPHNSKFKIICYWK